MRRMDLQRMDVSWDLEPASSRAGVEDENENEDEGRRTRTHSALGRFVEACSWSLHRTSSADQQRQRALVMSQSLLTTVVGSYPIPSWLVAHPNTPALRDALLVVLKTQELAGLDVLSDGELSRFNVNHPETNGMIEYFVEPLGGVDTRFGREEAAAFREQAGMGFRARPAGVVRQAIQEGTLDLPAAWAAVKGLTTRRLKFTVTSPYMLAKTLLDRHYRDLRALALAIAEVLRRQVAQLDAAVVQLDEANLTGHPEDAAWAHEPINHVLDAAPAGKAVHLCFGNYGGQSVQRGYWKALLPFLNRLHADHLLLEFARRGYEELDCFRDLHSGLALGVGVIDIKDNAVESPETIARRIEHAIKVLGAERIRWVHPDCGFWMLPRTVADRKMAALVQGRNLVAGLNP
jgi:5-methyltetrahydropteroyltriglutamate--homocysteine methyltransferase